MYGYRFIVRRLILPCVVCLFAGLAPVNSAFAMIASQAAAVQQFCSDNAERQASGSEFNGAGSWVWSQGLSHRACDSTEPTSKTGWCEMRWSPCTGGSYNGCYALGQFAGFPNSISGSWKLSYTGSSCAQVVPNQTGCASPDNAGICDYVDSVRVTAARADALASQTYDEQISTTAAVNANGQKIDNQTQAINDQTESLHGTSFVDGSYLSAGDLLARSSAWEEWGVRGTNSFRSDYEVPYYQQSLAAANQTNSLLSNLSTSGLAVNTGNMEGKQQATTNAINASGAAIRDSVNNGNSELVNIRNFQSTLNQTSSTIADNTQDMSDAMNALLSAQNDTTTAVGNAAEYIAQAYINAAPDVTVNTDLSPVTAAVNANGQKIDNTITAIGSLENAVITGNTSLTQAANEIKNSLGGNVAVPSGIDFSSAGSASAFGSAKSASGLGSVGELASKVVNFASLDQSGFLGSASQNLPVITFVIPLGIFDDKEVVWDLNDIIDIMLILRAFMWISVWMMTLNIIVARRK